MNNIVFFDMIMLISFEVDVFNFFIMNITNMISQKY